MARLNGKVAAVSGGASGIGEATVRRFVTEGAKVAFADRDADRGKRVAAEIAASGGEVVFVEAHVEREAEASAFVRQAAQRFGRLDVLVNNAGVRLYHTVEEATAALVVSYCVVLPTLVTDRTEATLTMLPPPP